MDQGTVVLDFNKTRNDPYNWKMIQVAIESYVCPSASYPSARPENLGYASYRGNLGWHATVDPVTHQQLPGQTLPGVPNGIFYQNSQVNLRDVTDGTTQTFLFGESQLGPYWGDCASCCSYANDEHPLPAANARITITPINFDLPHWRTANNKYYSFGSFHSDVVNFTIVDGSVHTIAKNIDSAMFRYLCTRNGREAITISF